MATLTDRLSALFRYRVGKYNSQTIEAEMGINPIVRSGVNVTEQSALAISTVYACRTGATWRWPTSTQRTT